MALHIKSLWKLKAKRSQTLALRWLLEAARKRKNKTMSDKLFNELMDASQKKVQLLKKEKILIKWQSLIRLLLITGGNHDKIS